MKYKTTKKAILQNYRCFKTGFCNLQYLLQYETPESYTFGKDGWHADIYNLGGGLALITGYQPFGDSLPYDDVHEYDQKAARIVNGDGRWEEKKEKVDKLLQEFIDNVIKGKAAKV